MLALVTHPLVATVRSTLARHGDPARAASQQAYMKSAMPYRGITNPELKQLLRPVFADPALRIEDREEWEGAVRDLWDGAAFREDRYAATALTGHRAYRSWQDPELLPLYRHLVVTGAWWDHVDEVASNRVGPILLSHKETVEPVIRAWATDDDLWLRRTAVISQLTFKTNTDTDLLREVVEANLDDTSFWLRKAIGWALRQHARTDPDWVRDFVAEHEGRLSGLSRREALKHL
jgi:3-methyladenine DNA glycosylase AlkD